MAVINVRNANVIWGALELNNLVAIDSVDFPEGGGLYTKEYKITSDSSSNVYETTKEGLQVVINYEVNNTNIANLDILENNYLNNTEEMLKIIDNNGVVRNSFKNAILFDSPKYLLSINDGSDKHLVKIIFSVTNAKRFK